jgi:hypothetical protein
VKLTTPFQLCCFEELLEPLLQNVTRLHGLPRDKFTLSSTFFPVTGWQNILRRNFGPNDETGRGGLMNIQNVEFHKIIFLIG